MRPSEATLVRDMLASMIGGRDPAAGAREELCRMTGSADWRVLVFESAGQLIGFCALKDNPFEGADNASEIVFFHIDGSVRGCGLGTLCLAAVEQGLATRGVRTVYAKVNPSNRPAVCFWITRGYEFQARLLRVNGAQDLYLLAKAPG